MVVFDFHRRAKPSGSKKRSALMTIFRGSPMLICENQLQKQKKEKPTARTGPGPRSRLRAAAVRGAWSRHATGGAGCARVRHHCRIWRCPHERETEAPPPRSSREREAPSPRTLNKCAAGGVGGRGKGAVTEGWEREREILSPWFRLMLGEREGHEDPRCHHGCRGEGAD